MVCNMVFNCLKLQLSITLMHIMYNIHLCSVNGDELMCIFYVYLYINCDCVSLNSNVMEV